MDPRRHPSSVQNSPPSLHRTFQRDDDGMPDDFYSSPVRGQRLPSNDILLRRRRLGHDPRRSPSPPTLRGHRGTREDDHRGNSFSPEREHSWSFRGASSAARHRERSPDSTRSLGRPREDSLNDHGPLRIKNLSWVNPNSIKIKTSAEQTPSKPALTKQISSPDDAARNTEQERADFNGIKDVPRGPRSSITILPSIDNSYKTLPHVLVQGDSLPADPDMIRHLEGFLRRFSPTSIHFDDCGYYVVFPDSPKGHKSLNACVNAKDRSVFFGTYVLRLEPFHHGQAACEPLVISLNGNVQTEEQSTDPRLRHKAKVSSEPKTTLTRSSPILRPSLPSLVLANEHWRNSSPLCPPSRQSMDDASSLSGKTTVSDTSSASKLKCHVCKLAQATENDALVRCSTCPRRYHRRCHASSPIPTTPEQQETWQCRRCMVKHVPQRKAPAVGFEASPAEMQTEPTIAIGTTDERPAKRARLEGVDCDARTQVVDVVMQMAPGFVSENAAAGTSGQQTLPTKPAGNSTTKDAQHAGSQACASMSRNEPQNTMEPESAMQPEGGFANVLPMDEADLLVEESFALPVTSVGGLQKKASKLNLVRKKLARPAQEVLVSATETADKTERVGHASSAMMAQAFVSAKDTSVSNDNALEGQTLTTAAIAADTGVLPEVLESPAAVRNMTSEHEQPAYPSETRMSSALDRRIDGAQESTVPAYRASASRSPGVAQPARKAPNVDPSLPTAKRTKSVKTIVSCSVCKKRTFGLKAIGHALCSECKAKKAAIQDHKTRDDATPAVKSMEESRGSSVQAFAPEVALSSKSLVKEQPAPDDTTLTGVVEKSAEIGHVQTELSPPTNENEDGILDFWISTNGENGPNTSEHVVGPPRQEIAAAQEGRQPASASTYNVMSSEAQVESHPQATPLEETAKPEPAEPETAASASPRLENTTHDISMASSGDETPARQTWSRRGRGRQVDRPYTWDEYIRFALIDSPGYRLQGRGICDWLLKNIPEWCTNDALESRISMTLSAHDAMKGKRLWNRKKRQDSDKGTIGKGDWYVLETRLVEDQPRWDPVLKRAVSPFAQTEGEDAGESDVDEESVEDEDVPPVRPRRAGKLAPERAKTDAQSKTAPSQTSRHPAQSVSSMTPAGHAAKSAKASGPRREGSHFRPEHVHRPNGASKFSARVEPSEDTSEDEPLASRRSAVPKTSAPTANMYTPAADTLVDEDGVMIDVGLPDLTSGSAKASSRSETSSIIRATLSRMPHVPTPESMQLSTNDKDGVSLAERIRADADNIDYSVESLFDEWPQYDPKNEVDNVAKLQEIKQRPTRKQIFGRSAMDSRLGNKVTANASLTPDSAAAANFTANSSFEQRSNRSPQKQAYAGLPALEATVREVVTIEELFGAPANPIPVMKGGKLWFRDGTLDRSGKLPRALVYYPTGYD
ncbi:hypothetical protein LTR86_001065 [Recurvomyces mirabilis]|nr:hypothetical protein LTR86_001065 [Recurvomyces mirabilis]